MGLLLLIVLILLLFGGLPDWGYQLFVFVTHGRKRKNESLCVSIR